MQPSICNQGFNGIGRGTERPGQKPEDDVVRAHASSVGHIYRNGLERDKIFKGGAGIG